jgi:hypothetical protein
MSRLNVILIQRTLKIPSSPRYEDRETLRTVLLTVTDEMTATEEDVDKRLRGVDAIDTYSRNG